MNGSLHLAYVGGSLLAGILSVVGLSAETPFLYTTLPGLIGLLMVAVASVRFVVHKKDLAGFVATFSGFVFYQAFQANPVTQPEFIATLASLQDPDRYIGLFLGNFTAGMLLIANAAVGRLLKRGISSLVPSHGQAARSLSDPGVRRGFWIVFALVAAPNVLFGMVVVGALKNIIYQRSAWSGASELSGYIMWGGPVGASLLNTVFWSTSLFILWIYLLGSRFKRVAYVVGPLVLIWTAGVALQGSRTYFVVLAFVLIIYALGHPRLKGHLFLYGVVGIPLTLIILQASTLFRTEGLAGFRWSELAERAFEIRGNEGTTSQIDGLEFFRTEMVERGTSPNPLVGVLRGLVERPVEGLLMPVPRTLFPWKPVDETARDFSLFFQNVRLGVTSSETFLGASPGLIGREVIRYGFLGPLTLMFWMGLLLATADRLYAAAPGSDFHRIFAAALVAFVVAQMRDWVPMWVLPFLPCFLILGYVARRAKGRRVTPVRRIPAAVRPPFAARVPRPTR